jgi:23S rRNA pseudouridine1911/1915/1917 synthase
LNEQKKSRSYHFTVNASDAVTRLDAYLSERVTQFSRSQIQAMIEADMVRVNQRICTKSSQRIFSGDTIECQFKWSTPEPDMSAQAMALNIVFEDDDIIVINKDAGIVVHAGAANWSGTLVNGLIHHFPPIVSVGQSDRPGIVHRLDKETSGLMVVAKSDAVFSELQKAFAHRKVGRTYRAICLAPKLEKEGCFDTLYGRHPKDRVKFSSKVTTGKRAITNYRVLETLTRGFALIECKLTTGRTHQVRVHLNDHGAPILGDKLYAARPLVQTNLIARQALHAAELELKHPKTAEDLHFIAPPPDDFEQCLRILR